MENSNDAGSVQSGLSAKATWIVFTNLNLLAQSASTREIYEPVLQYCSRERLETNRECVCQHDSVDQAQEHLCYRHGRVFYHRLDWEL
jgi:uncharacterized paraquat-inducible protein A